MCRTPHFYKIIFKRFKTKLLAIGITIISALVLSGVLALVLLIIKDFLPANIQEMLSLINDRNSQPVQNELKLIFDSYPGNKEVLFLTVQVFQTFFAPIPGQLTGILGGFLFGFWKGIWLTMLGMTIGSGIAMSITRFFSRTIVRKFVPQEMLTKFDYLTNENGLSSFFIIFLLPALPDDAVCFIAGLTRLSLIKLLIISFIGRLPGTAAVVFAGANLETNPLWTKSIIIVGILIALFVWFFDKEILQFLSRKRSADLIV